MLHKSFTMRNTIVFLLFTASLLSCNNYKQNKLGTNSNHLDKDQGLAKEEYVQLVPDSIVSSTLHYFMKLYSMESFNSSKYLDKTPFCVISSQDSIYYTKLDSIFSKADLDFIFRQNTNSKLFELSRFFRDKEFVSADTLSKFYDVDGAFFWEKYHKKYGEGGYSIVSVPIFSVNKEIVIIKYIYACGGMCGFGHTFIYKKEKNEWKEILCLERWIS